jgi:hypothetical protein
MEIGAVACAREQFMRSTGGQTWRSRDGNGIWRDSATSWCHLKLSQQAQTKVSASWRYCQVETKLEEGRRAVKDGDLAGEIVGKEDQMQNLISFEEQQKF